MELITGHANEPHISAADVAAMMRGVYGETDCVTAEGEQLACTMSNANTAEIGTGGCMLQGHYARVELAEQLSVRSGSAGYKRNDLVVARYELASDNTQSVTLAVLEGEATTNVPVDPVVDEGDIDGGDSKAEFPLWRIPINGVNVGTPERVMPVLDAYQAGIAEVQDEISDVRESVSQTFTDFTATTSGGGNITSTIPKSKRIFGAFATSAEAIVQPWTSSARDSWLFRATRSDGTVYANTSMTVRVYHD